MRNRKPESNKPRNGVGKVALGEKSFTLSLTFKNKEGEVIDQDKFTFKYTDLPEDIPDEWEMKSGKEYLATISADGSKLIAIRPAKGSFVFVSRDFARNDEGDFKILEKEGQWGPYLEFIPLLTVDEGPNKGINYPLYLILGNKDKLKLTHGENDLMETTLPDKPKGNAAMFRDYLEYTKVYEEDIPYPMDGDEPDDDPQAILTALLKVVKKQKARFQGMVENGYPKSLAEVEDETEPESEQEKAEVAEEKPAKKNGKHKWDED